MALGDVIGRSPACPQPGGGGPLATDYDEPFAHSADAADIEEPNCQDWASGFTCDTVNLYKKINWLMRQTTLALKNLGVAANTERQTINWECHQINGNNFRLNGVPVDNTQIGNANAVLTVDDFQIAGASDQLLAQLQIIEPLVQSVTTQVFPAVGGFAGNVINTIVGPVGMDFTGIQTLGCANSPDPTIVTVIIGEPGAGGGGGGGGSATDTRSVTIAAGKDNDLLGTDLVIAGAAFDGTGLTAAELRVTTVSQLTGAATAVVELWDMGDGVAAAPGTLVSTVSFTVADNGPNRLNTQALTIGAGGPAANSILNGTRVYEIRTRINGGTAGDHIYLYSADIKL